MKFTTMVSLVGWFALTVSTSTIAEEWISIDNGDELRRVLSGKSLDGGEFADYYRSDGAMGYINREYGTIVVRKWVVSDDGELCTYIYVMPEKLVECARFERSGIDQDLYRMTIISRGGNKMQARLTDTPEQTLIDAVNNVAGPVN